ncbi:MAG: two-partner secretion domain-containing protein [Planctomycetota bacterium]|jgi:filamentous hemagglutinin family protein
MEKLRKISKEYYLRQIVSCWLVFYMFFCFGIPAQIAMAVPPTPIPTTDGPLGDGFVHGAGLIDQVNPWTDVTVQTQESIIHWQTINTGKGEDLNYLQDGVVNANVLNRVTSGIGTEFYGNLNAEQGMSIWVLNPAGILFGEGSSVNVTNLVASSLEILNDDFLNGAPYEFTGGVDAGVVEFRGSTTDMVEKFALIGREVINKGALVADQLVVMAAGDTVLISENSPVVVEASMGAGVPSDFVVNNHEDGSGIEVDGDTAQVILAAGDIWSSALVKAYSDGGSDAVATVEILAAGDLTVDDQITAEAVALGGGDNASASVTIDAGGDVTVGADGRVEAKVGILNYGGGPMHEYAGNADADVYITTPGVVTVDGVVEALTYVVNQDFPEAGEIFSGNAYANVTIDNIVGDGVTVGPEGGIAASSTIVNYEAQEETVFSGDAFAGIDIESCGDVIVDGQVSSLATVQGGLLDRGNGEYSKDTYADIKIKAYGDVVVNSEAGGGSNGRIKAQAFYAEKNTADITILAVSDVIVNDGIDAVVNPEEEPSDPSLHSPQEIMAFANCGSINKAHIGIATRDGVDEGDVIVGGQIGAHARSSNPLSDNTSAVEISAARDVIVEGGYAEIGFPEGPVVFSEEGGQIMAKSSFGSLNKAAVDIFAGRDVIVHGADIEYFEPIANGGEFLTQAIGGMWDGGQILALTYGSGVPRKEQDLDKNTSSVGIYAQDDVTIHDATVTGEPQLIRLNGNGGKDDGQVLAGAHGHDSINDADVVICAQDDVTIDGKVIAEAGTTIDPDNEHYADIKISAGDDIAGTGWTYAEADPSAKVAEASIVLRSPDAGNILIEISDQHFGITDHDNPAGDGLPDTEIGPVDCPECEFEWIDWTWCEDCEEVFAPVAPLAPFRFPRIEGCPELMLAAAMEVGIMPETIQVAIGNALALNPNIQPCEACETLVDAASILRDEDGSRMAAMVQTFNALAPADAPFTPEMATSIAMAFEGAAEGTQYASVMEYVDAFVQYVAVLDTELGSPVEDSVAFVMGKYGAGITESDNANIAAFVATRLEGLETFSD